MAQTEYPEVTIGDIARAYWAGLRPWKWWIFSSVMTFVVVEIINVIIPIYYKEFFDALGASVPGAGVGQMLSIVVIIFILNVLWVTLRWVAYQLAIVGDGGTIPLLKQQAFEKLIHHSYSFFADNFTGSMVSRVQRFAAGYERLGETVYSNIIPLIINVGGAVVVIYTQQPILAYLVGAWAGLFLFANYVFARWRFKHNVALAVLDSRASGTLADAVSNHSAITLFNAFDGEVGRYRDVTEEQAAKQRFLWRSGTGMDAFQLFFVVTVELLVFYFALDYWNQGSVTLGMFVLLQVFILQIGSKLTSFARVVRTMYEVHAQATEMLQIMKLDPGIADSVGATALAVSDGTIQFENVTFNFNETRNVFKDFKLTIPGRQKVALVGPSGAGKTTIIRLVLRLYNVTDGKVTIDSQDIAEVTQSSVRDAIAFVPQDPALFHRTLMENIRYGRSDATDEEVIQAAKSAHCDEFIDVLPDKYETYVGERGVKLSGGERQRVAIARAILKNAPILILDEATSSLDSQSEALIQDALDVLMRDKTVIVIAHRLSTIRKMDRILVIDNGVIREDGTHEELLKSKDSLYKALWDLQAGGFIVEKDE